MSGDILRGLLTNYGGTITTGGTAQQVIAANPIRNYLLVQNPSAAPESLFVDFGEVASTASIELVPGMTLTFESSFMTTQYVSMYAATTGHAFVIKEG